MAFVVSSITRYIVTYLTIVRYSDFIVGHCVVASTLYYDKKTPKFARPSDGPPLPPIPKKVSKRVFCIKTGIVSISITNPKMGVFENVF